MSTLTSTRSCCLLECGKGLLWNRLGAHAHLFSTSCDSKLCELATGLENFKGVFARKCVAGDSLNLPQWKVFLCHRGHGTIRILRPMEAEKREPGNEVDRVAGVLRPLYSLFLKPIKMDPATEPSTVWSLISPRLHSKERSETQDCRCACVEHEKNA